MPVYAVLYTYGPGTDAVRDEHRPAHRAFLNDTDHGDVEILATGPWADGDPGALIIARGPDRDAVTDVFDRDPFHVVGSVSEREIREWTQVRTPWL